MLPLDKRSTLGRVGGYAVNVSDNGLKLIAEFEGFGPYLYNDPVGHATVGYGYLVHLGNYHEARGVCAKCDRWARKSEKHLWMSPTQGRQLLAETARPYALAVETQTRPLNQNEFDALTSLCYNIGQGGYANSKVRQAVNAGKDPCYALRQIVKGTDGVTYPGLVRRREAECKLFHTPVEEDDMSERVWCPELFQTWLVGKGGAAPITDPAYDKVMEAAYGGHTKTMTAAELKAIEVK